MSKLTNNDPVDLVFTDPPYSQQTQYGPNSKLKNKKTLDNLKEDDLNDFVPEDFLKALPGMFRNGHHNSFIFTNKNLLPDYLYWAKQNKVSFNVLVWKKPSCMPLGGGHYSDIEYLLYFRKNSTWNNENNYPGANRHRVLEYPKPTGVNHTTPKPIALIENQIRLTTKPGEIVLDPYIGGGTTMLACINSGRICYGVEILPKYADMTLDRAEEYSGVKAVKLEL